MQMLRFFIIIFVQFFIFRHVRLGFFSSYCNCSGDAGVDVSPSLAGVLISYHKCSDDAKF